MIQWLRSSKAKQPVFVANRVGENLHLTTIDHWNHVPGVKNPADIVTCGLSASELCQSDWLRGPKFLKDPTSFPFKPQSEVDNFDNVINDNIAEEVKANSNVVDSFLDFSSFSSFQQLQRVICYVLRPLKSHKHYRTTNACIENPEELRYAKFKLLELAQKQSFPEDWRSVENSEFASKRSRLSQFASFVGSENVLRSRGRTNRLSAAEFDVKHPVLLDAKHPAIRLMLLNSINNTSIWELSIFVLK